jgi:hypothetical protein
MGNNKDVLALVRIDSSNRGGSQITATWDFWLTNVSGKWCVKFISKKN